MMTYRVWEYVLVKDSKVKPVDGCLDLGWAKVSPNTTYVAQGDRMAQIRAVDEIQDQLQEATDRGARSR